MPMERQRRAARHLRVAMVHISDFRLDSRIQRQARALAERGDEVDLVCVGEREELRVGEGVIRVHPVVRGEGRPGARAPTCAATAAPGARPVAGERAWTRAGASIWWRRTTCPTC